MRLSILDQVRVSCAVDATRTLGNSIDLARLGDALGYERYWVAEHHGSEQTACSCPEVLLGRIGAETSEIRIGAGGILLPHYSPLKVAETFRTLDALYPNRVDLGIGRAPGCGVLETHALKRFRVEAPFAEDFREQLTELLDFLNGEFASDHQFRDIRVAPDTPGQIPVWLLGSSPSSAAIAADLGLPYAFAQFICPTLVQNSFEFYRREFQPKDKQHQPAAILAVGAICLETESKVQELAAIARARRPAAEPRPGIEKRVSTRKPWERFCFAGTAETLRDDLLTAATISQVDELMILTPLDDHETCMKSYQLLAEAFDLKRRL